MRVKYRTPRDAATMFHARVLVRLFLDPTLSVRGALDDCELPAYYQRRYVEQVRGALARAARSEVA